MVKNQIKKSLAALLAVIMLLTVLPLGGVFAAGKTLVNISDKYDYINDYNYGEQFTISGKRKISVTYKSAVKSDIEIYRYVYDENYTGYEEDSVVFEYNVKSFNKTITLEKGTYYIKLSTDVFEDYDYDEDYYDKSYSYSLSIKDVTVFSNKIKFENSKKSCSVGSRFTLKPTLSPSGSIAKSIKYSSSNSKIATVSKSGVVTAKRLGKCTITAKLDNGKSAKFTVTVNKSNLYIFKGSTRKAPSVNGKTNAKWKSSSTKTASVNGNRFKGVKQGATKITTKVSGIKYTCNVYVVDYNKMYKKGINIYKDNLKDPDSLKIYHIYRGYDKYGSPTIILDSGAKNGYGGMVRNYCYIWAEYDKKSKKFYYDYYTSEVKTDLTCEKKIK